jgi:adenylylsulfate kinase
MVARTRHLVKAVTWRIIASVTTALIALTFGVPAKAVGAIFIADLIIKFALYYAHERVWYNYIKFGIKE